MYGCEMCVSETEDSVEAEQFRFDWFIYKYELH